MMAEDEKKDGVEETAQDDSSSTPPADDAPQDGADVADDSAAEGEEKVEEPDAGGAEPAASEDDDLHWKARKRLERSRQPHKARPQMSAEERTAERGERRKRKAGERRKERAAAKGEKKAGAGTPRAERDAVAAKVRQGVVVSDKGQKSITVRVDIVRRHPTYEKVVRNTRTLHAHDERDEAGEGDVVRVVETRPLSKTKRWRLVEVLEKAK